MKHILIVGSQSPASIENHYCSGLRRLGWEVSVFEPCRYFETRSLLSRVRIRIGDLSIYRRVNRQLIIECNRLRPDVVWVFKGVEIMPETIVELKKLGILTVNFNPDHPFIRTSVCHGFRNIPDCVPLYDIFFTYSKELAESLGSRAVWLPFGYELSSDQFLAIAEQPEILRACFLGTVDSHRAITLKNIAKGGVPVDVYGPLNRHAKRLRDCRQISLYPTVFDDDFWRVVRAYRIHLNFFRPHNIGSHNQRSFEIPAAGGILLSPFSSEQCEFFTPDNEMYFYQNQEEMSTVIDRVLSQSKASAAAFRTATRQRSLDSNYSYFFRSEFASSVITKSC